MFPDAVPLGVRSASEERMMLNPPDDYVLEKGAPLHDALRPNFTTRHHLCIPDAYRRYGV